MLRADSISWGMQVHVPTCMFTGDGLDVPAGSGHLKTYWQVLQRAWNFLALSVRLGYVFFVLSANPSRTCALDKKKNEFWSFVLGLKRIKS